MYLFQYKESHLYFLQLLFLLNYNFMNYFCFEHLVIKIFREFLSASPINISSYLMKVKREMNVNKFFQKLSIKLLVETV